MPAAGSSCSLHLESCSFPRPGDVRRPVEPGGILNHLARPVVAAAAVAVPERWPAPGVVDIVDSTPRRLAFQALCCLLVRQRCRGIDVGDAVRHHTLADACGPAASCSTRLHLRIGTHTTAKSPSRGCPKARAARSTWPTCATPTATRPARRIARCGPDPVVQPSCLAAEHCIRAS